jgi:signal peptidase II
LFIGATAIAVADQAIKLAILAAQPHVTMIPGFFAIRFATNTGAAFSLFREFPGALTILGFGVLAGLVVYALRSAATATVLARVVLALFMGGAVGNLIDRVRLGYVVDYLDVFVGDYHWPMFNLADSAISIGAAIVLFASFRGRAAAGIVLCAFAGLAADASAADFSRYMPRKIHELIAASPSRPGLVITPDVPIRPKVTYSAELRDLPEDSIRLIAAWSQAMNVSGMREAFRRELKTLEIGREYWVPVQEVLFPVMRRELQPGEEIELFMIYIGQVDGRHLLLVNEFRHDSPH